MRWVPRDSNMDVPALPDQKDDLWKDAENEIWNVQPPRTCEKGQHDFVQINSQEAKCTLCPAGYILSPGAEVKRGHIYLDDLVI